MLPGRAFYRCRRTDCATSREFGGIEAVFIRQVDRIQVGERQLRGFEIDVGIMDYGFAINGLLGMNFSASVGGSH